jgi:hypothetical protein
MNRWQNKHSRLVDALISRYVQTDGGIPEEKAG